MKKVPAALGNLNCGRWGKLIVLITPENLLWLMDTSQSSYKVNSKTGSLRFQSRGQLQLPCVVNRSPLITAFLSMSQQ
jgi:hypothetical protein